LSWFFDLNGGEDAMYLGFSFVGHKYLVYQHELSSARELQPMTKDAFKVIMANVNQQCEGVMVGLIK